MNMKNILLLCGILAKEYSNQVLEDIKKYIQEDGGFESHTANIDDIRDIFRSCDFFLFRHHRSSADRFERVVKSAENAFLLKTIKAVRGVQGLSNQMGKIVANYNDEVKKCEPILLSNVLTVETHYKDFLPDYMKLDTARKALVDEHLYLRMRNFERAAKDAKRLNKAKDKEFDIDFAWNTSLSNKWREDNKNNKDVQDHIQKYFKNGVPELYPIFDEIFKKYQAQLKAIKDGKAVQLVSYFYYKQPLGILDRGAWPADQKQADQMKRWLERGTREPTDLLEKHSELNKTIDDMVKELKRNSMANQTDKKPVKINPSWFKTRVDDVIEESIEQRLQSGSGELESHLYGNSTNNYLSIFLFSML